MGGGYYNSVGTNAYYAFVGGGASNIASGVGATVAGGFQNAALDRSVLEKVVALPIQTWNYTNEPAAIRHLGPVVQDFHAAFDLNGEDDKHITDVDEAGVALAAIQGLNQKEEDRASIRAKDVEIKELKEQNRDLSLRLSELEALVSSLAHSVP